MQANGINTGHQSKRSITNRRTMFGHGRQLSYLRKSEVLSSSSTNLRFSVLAKAQADYRHTFMSKAGGAGIPNLKFGNPSQGAFQSVVNRQTATFGGGSGDLKTGAANANNKYSMVTPRMQNQSSADRTMKRANQRGASQSNLPPESNPPGTVDSYS